MNPIAELRRIVHSRFQPIRKSMGSERHGMAICTCSLHPASIPPLITSSQYLVYCGWLIIELVFVVTYIVETKGRTLEETAALFDGDREPQDLVQRGGEAATMTMTRGGGRKDNLTADFLEMQPVSINISSDDDLSTDPSDRNAKDVDYRGDNKDQLDHLDHEHPYYIEAV